MKKEGIPPHEIFIEGELDFEFIDLAYMRKTLDRWCDLYDEYGEVYFSEELRGKRGKGKKLDNNDLDNWEAEDLKMMILVYENMIEELGKKKASPKK